jgi:hypothetical protein
MLVKSRKNYGNKTPRSSLSGGGEDEAPPGTERYGLSKKGKEPIISIEVHIYLVS